MNICVYGLCLYTYMFKLSIYLNIQRDQSKKVYGQIGIRDST